MYQSFDVQGGPELGRRNLPALRAAIAELGLAGFLVPHEDEYQNEYLPAANERLAWATGFTGSAGAALILADAALLFVDGRYTLQAKTQTDPDLIEVRDLVTEGVGGWLRSHTLSDAALGYDPRLHSPDAIAKLEEAAKAAGARLRAIAPNPIDVAWEDRPPAPAAAMVPHPIDVAGEAHADKRARLAVALRREGLEAAVITDPASVAWLLNIRGGDVAHTPVCLGAAVLHADARVTLFVDPAKVTDAARTHLGEEVELRAESEFAAGLGALGGRAVSVDPAATSAFAFAALESAGAAVTRAPDVCALPRACKNAVEVAGAKRAHQRDGAALTSFLHWLAQEGPTGAVDEIGAAERVEAFRRDAGDLKDVSFTSISGAGPNGAIVHYRVDRETNRRLQPGELYLIDSGGQYLDGTTDVTRTVAIGAPSDEMRARYTLVLKGHIALARVRFPEGTTGAQLDGFARQFLWSAGLDYDHGTGHGVGSYLSVHEGPQRIAKRPGGAALQAGMIVSNEPGYYQENAYGIRIENLQVVTPPAPIPGGERDMLGFEALTLAPLERALIDADRLSGEERAWVDAYHARVLAEIGPRVEGEVRGWLHEQCRPLPAHAEFGGHMELP